MRAILMWSRAEFRQRWRAWLGLAILIGLFGGAVVAAAAGARRTDSSYDRFIVSSRAWHAATFYVAWDPSFAELDPDKVEALPSVAEHARARYFMSSDERLSPVGPDETYSTRMNTPKFLEGRRPTAIDEVSVPYALSQRLGLHAGDRLTIPFLEGSEKVAHGDKVVEIELRIVGVHLANGPGEFPPSGGEENGVILLSRAFTEARSSNLGYFEGGFVRLHEGSAGVETFRKEIGPLAGGKPYFVFGQTESASVANEAVHLVALGLWVLGAALALVAILALGQTLARQFFLEGERFPTGRALGLTGRQMFAIGMTRAVAIGSAAAAIAVAIAIGLSPLAPVGIARVAEPTPGFAFDWFALGFGALGIIAVVAAISVFPALRAERAVRSRELQVHRGSRVARAAFRAGLPVPAATGIRLALEPGRGRTAVPIRSTLGAATVGIAAVIIAATLGASLNHLLESGDAYGITWDLDVEISQWDASTELTAEVAERIRGLDGVRDAAIFDSGIPLRKGETSVFSLAMDFSRTSLAPPLITGRYPAAADEIALGERTLRTLGARVGDSLEFGLDGVEPKPFTVVGVAMVPGFDTQASLGEGGLLHPSSVTRLIDQAPPISTIYVRFAEGADKASVRRTISEMSEVDTVLDPLLPEDLRNLQRIDSMPVILAGVLALLAAAAIAHGLASSVRRRSRDLATLLALGFVRGQVRATVAWQSLTFAVASLALGIPIGIGIGRWVWTASANELGVLPVPVVPSVVLGVVVAGAIAVALLVSAFPARTAARTRPAAILRAE